MLMNKCGSVDQSVKEFWIIGKNKIMYTFTLRFLEGLVKRLATEVSERQQRVGEEDSLGNKVREGPWMVGLDADTHYSFLTIGSS